MRFFTAVLASALVLAPAAMLAQTTTPTPGAHDYNINQRKVDQQDRIAQGVKSGQLTAGETGRLEHQEAGINREERGMRAQDNGHLTKQDRQTLHAQQNQESRRISAISTTLPFVKPPRLERKGCPLGHPFSSPCASPIEGHQHPLDDTIKSLG